MSLHPFVFARTEPERPALVFHPSGLRLSFAQLERRANRAAHLFRSLGLARGDCVAIMLENCPEFFEIALAADRSGLYLTAVSTKLTAAEAEYIVTDSGAKLFVTSTKVGEDALSLSTRLGDIPLFLASRESVYAVSAPFRDWRSEADAMSAQPIDDEAPGAVMLYSSGSTGRPKGVKPPLPVGSIIDPPGHAHFMEHIFGVKAGWTYLSPAPLYHAAPLGFAMVALRLGCTIVVLERFDEEETLRAIEAYRVDVAQFVPTHFIRMLKLPPGVRERYDTSSLKSVFHAAAPCPVPVKEQMMDWWGPIIFEYYAGTESNGTTLITPDEWLRKKGSVGRPVGCEIHICGEDGEPLPQGEVGQIFFSGGRPFEYHNDPEKTLASRNKFGWTSLDDIGWVDDEGFLYLTDRKSFMIISGGVNIYPQEIENILVLHPAVADVAVIGAPDADMGERVVAVVQLASGVSPSAEVAAELQSYSRQHLSGVKTPRQFDFIDALPRHPTGKIYKKAVRAPYWIEASNREASA